MDSLLDGKEEVVRQNTFIWKKTGLLQRHMHGRNNQIIIKQALNEQKLQTLKLSRQTNAKSCAYSMQHEDDGQSAALTTVMI